MRRRAAAAAARGRPRRSHVPCANQQLYQYASYHLHINVILLYTFTSDSVFKDFVKQLDFFQLIIGNLEFMVMFQIITSA